LDDRFEGTFFVFWGLVDILLSEVPCLRLIIQPVKLLLHWIILLLHLLTHHLKQPYDFLLLYLLFHLLYLLVFLEFSKPGILINHYFLALFIDAGTEAARRPQVLVRHVNSFLFDLFLGSLPLLHKPCFDVIDAASTLMLDDLLTDLVLYDRFERVFSFHKKDFLDAHLANFVRFFLFFV
jgi:hypothetical protein